MQISFAAAPLGPFGTGLPDTGGISAGGLFPGLFAWLVETQMRFNNELTSAVESIHHHGGAFWALIGIAFVYGIIHAVGPGHGKAVISGWIMANREGLRNGIMLAGLAAMAQAASAITLIALAALVLHLTSVSITRATLGFEVGSDLLIIALGLWLVWRRALRPLLVRRAALHASGGLGHLAFAAPAVAGATTSRFSAVDVVCDENDDCDCGGLHMPSAAAAQGRLDLRRAWSVVAATALRPCTGALIVLVFALSQHVLYAGIAATIAMSMGTALSVSILAALVVSLRGGLAMAATGPRSTAARLLRSLEILAACLLPLAGALMLYVHLNN
ncbi:MAG: nickel/cobalt transporter [Hyphomicrobiales bacterium]|nr:nickel/cobalt transporter [Hyphomicrobiales bacterium]